MKEGKYKVFGVVTNMDWDGNELIRWLYQPLWQERRGPQCNETGFGWRQAALR